MKKIELNSDSKFGHWEVIKEVEIKNGKRYWSCKCVCGTEKIINQSSLTSGNSKSCGCKIARKSIDLTGEKFGKLTVIRQLQKRINKRIVWRCKCDCGNHIDVKGIYLTTGEVKSCGCLKTEQDNFNFRDRYDEQYVENVNTSLLTSKIRADNKSGVKGVSQHKATGKWDAYITFGGTRKHLGRYTQKADAIRKRKEAEKKYHKPYLESE